MRRLAGVDVGGTFTDVVVLEADGRPRATKVPTTPDDQAEAVVRGLTEMAGSRATVVGHGTTTATNAILEGSTGGTVLVTTDGFSGLLAIGRQDRPSLYDIRQVRPSPLVEGVVTVRERTGADGRLLVELTESEVARVTEAVAGLRPRSVAINLLFSFADPTHEERLETAIRRRLDVPVTRSSRLLPEFREYERASTCVLNAALAPVMSRYLDGLGRRLGGSTVWVMTSAGGTASLDFAAEAPVHTLLSGPAAGVVAAAAVALRAGFHDAVALDLGGTSTDACLIKDGRPDVLGESQIAGFPFRTAAVAVHTVGAGGGSVAWMDEGGALRVGPRSAGARPGPACYGQGGNEPTVTDAHCALGHLDPERPLGEGSLRLDPEAARRALAALPSPAGGAEGILRVTRATMARALRRVTTERGVSPSGLALVAYGGAGPLHATTLARELGCRAVIVPSAPGVFSALGLLLAPARHEASRTVLGFEEGRLPALWRELDEAAREELHRQGAEAPIELTRFADCRYPGQSHELRVKAADLEQAALSFHEAHRLAYGYALPEETVEVVTLRVIAQASPHLETPPTTWDHGAPRPEQKREVQVEGEVLTARIIDRAGLSPGDVVRGPAVVEQADATTLLLPDDTAVVDRSSNLVVRLDG